mgnify:CR=1 FL=1
MRDIIFKQGKHLVIATLIVTIAASYIKQERYEKQIMACKGLIRRVFLDKPEYYLDTLCATEEYSQYIGAFDYKGVKIDD